MRASLLLCTTLLLAALPACTEMDDASGMEFCEQPYECPDISFIDCMPDAATDHADICDDMECREWVALNCGTYVAD